MVHDTNRQNKAVVTVREAEDLRIDLSKFEFVGEETTPPIRGLFSGRVRRKLREYIDHQREKAGADLAVINYKTTAEDLFTIEICYDYLL